MKDNFIHVCFIIDESGSMYGSENDVIGGYNKTIEEQKEIKDGTCAVSLYKFHSYVNEIFTGKDINELETLQYNPGGSTALYDAIGTAVTNIGKWLSDMPEEERPSKNLIVIMTDGEENSSKIYSLSTIKEMIKHQEEVYNWTFIYMGADLTNTTDADNLGISNKLYATKDDYKSHYSTISAVTSSFRCADAMYALNNFSTTLNDKKIEMNENYKNVTGLKNLNI